MKQDGSNKTARPFKYVTVLCEGPNDALLMRRMSSFFEDYGYHLRTRSCQGIDSLLSSSPRLVKRYFTKGPVVLLFDHADLKDGDLKRFKAAEELGPMVLAVPVVEKIEAWLMADTEALYNSTGVRYRGPVPTDRIEDPKRFFLHFCRVAVRKGKRKFLSRETDFFRSVTWRWDLSRARGNNVSLDRFCKRFSGICF